MGRPSVGIAVGEHVRSTSMQCFRCGASSWHTTIDLGTSTYVACDQCSLTRLEPFPDPTVSAELYGDEYFVGASNGGYADYLRDARCTFTQRPPPNRATRTSSPTR